MFVIYVGRVKVSFVNNVNGAIIAFYKQQSTYK